MHYGLEKPNAIIPDWSKVPIKGHTLSKKISAALRGAPDADLLFIHRDADGRDSTARYTEIAQAIESLGVLIPYVAVVPVQETEAWLLLDEKAIRDVAENPTGRVRLNLPSPKQVEKIANPKERLKEALAKASGLKGRRLKKFRKFFPTHRRELLEIQDYSGPLSKVPAFKRLSHDISQAIEKLKQAQVKNVKRENGKNKTPLNPRAFGESKKLPECTGI